VPSDAQALEIGIINWARTALSRRARIGKDTAWFPWPLVSAGLSIRSGLIELSLQYSCSRENEEVERALHQSDDLHMVCSEDRQYPGSVWKVR